MNIEDIDKCVAMLEQGETTFSNCQKLASLLIVRKYLAHDTKDSNADDMRSVEKELCDILPHYNKYCQLKAEYQRSHMGKESVLEALGSVCKEIREYLQALYSSTDMPEERKLLQDLISNFTFNR